ncbi:hypothetical protein MKW98_028423 [Papaver atlanticum]|uniref:Uncharacterized protein n=1 Tax=Papaver atlanticum TaxID=357466 RepID=A0AAD4SW80_9MAGN|nr:hypothetical protein MKW98_028423 [Papaver atlanticum]
MYNGTLGQFKYEGTRPVHVPRSVTLPITTAKEGLPSGFKSSNNVKRTAAESKSNANASTKTEKSISGMLQTVLFY